MSGWKHDREWYLNRVRSSGRWALIFFVLFLISFSIFAIENFRGWFGLASAVFLLLGFILLRLRAYYQYCSHRAPARL